MLDYIHVMTYDFHGLWEHNVGENSPLYKGPSDQGSMIYYNVVSEGVIIPRSKTFFYSCFALIKITIVEELDKLLCILLF